MVAERRALRVVHAIEGRLRLRLPWLRRANGEATALADAMATWPGIVEVQVRPLTGSVLCWYDGRELSESALIERVAEAAGAESIVPLGQEPPPQVRAHPGDGQRSSVARALARGVREINADTLNATDGRLDLGTIAALGFIGAGALEVLTTRQLPVPPWFNLAWWALQTFTTFESDSSDASDASDLTDLSDSSD